MLSSKGPIEENASPRDDLIRVFAHYADRVLSYMILYSPKECVKIRQWLERFYKMDRTEKDLKQRNEYISYLVVQMQNGKVGQPFNKNPPSITRTLVDLNVALVPDEYKNTLMDFHKQGLEKQEADSFKPNLCARSRKENFLYCQPEPSCGFTAFGACFSGQDKSN